MPSRRTCLTPFVQTSLRAGNLTPMKQTEKARGAPKIIQSQPAGPDHRVVSVQGPSKAGYRRTPCKGCPWRVENDGLFPAEAFVHSAGTAHDMSQHIFACHESGIAAGHACAGFLLRGADHNMSVRIGRMIGKFKPDVAAAGAVLHDGYRDMAIANGVAADDPCLALCR